MDISRLLKVVILICVAFSCTGCGSSANGVSPIVSDSADEAAALVKAASTTTGKTTGATPLVAYGIDIQALAFGNQGVRNSVQSQFNTIVTAYDQERYDLALEALVEFSGHIDAQRGKQIPEETYTVLKAFADALTLNISAVSIALDPGAITLKPSQSFDLKTVTVTATRADGTTGLVTLAISWSGPFVSGSEFVAPGYAWQGTVICKVANKIAELVITVVPEISFEIDLQAEWFKNTGIKTATQEKIAAIKTAYDLGDIGAAREALAEFVHFITIKADKNLNQKVELTEEGFLALKAFADRLAAALN